MCTPARCTHRTPNWRCRTPATCSRGAPKASACGWSGRATSPPATRSTATRCSIQRSTRRSGIRPTSCCPTKSPTCEQPMDALLEHVLRQGDRALILAQRLLQQITHAPEIEEDMALANVALDLIGQARYLYTYAGEI